MDLLRSRKGLLRNCVTLVPAAFLQSHQLADRWIVGPSHHLVAIRPQDPAPNSSSSARPSRSHQSTTPALRSYAIPSLIVTLTELDAVRINCRRVHAFGRARKRDEWTFQAAPPGQSSASIFRICVRISLRAVGSVCVAHEGLSLRNRTAGKASAIPKLGNQRKTVERREIFAENTANFLAVRNGSMGAKTTMASPCR
jgi:hypothetical protein